ncbi:hypothetical protein ABIB38_002041 [Massilia sp. UYP11]|uniref:transporter n=1 Tax=Massilia sp. UYP11 TaxID=1756385 RepID=UPI003D2543BF
MQQHRQSRPSSLRKAACALAAAGLAALLAPATAAEIPTDPGDYVALPAGTDLGILYYQRAEYKAVYADGKRLAVPFNLVTDIGVARWVHYTKLGDYLVTPQVIIPFGKVDVRSQSASGVGDPIVGSALWLVNRPEEKRWATVSAFVSLPVGKYDGAQGPINLGENRWKGVLQSSYMTALSANLMLDLVGEYALYGENDDFVGLRRKQDASYGGQVHLRYNLSPATALSLSYYHDFGGESKLNGVAQHDRMNNSRFLVGLAGFVSPTVQLQLQAGKSLKVTNGVKESSRINLRLVKVL